MSYSHCSRLDRRRFLSSLTAGGAFITVRGAFAQALVETPAQTLGPFYPDRLPLDQDNDLLIINDAITPAVGEITWLSGRVLDRSGNPVRGAVVEIWQTDNSGAYIHSQSPIRNRDTNFQGYGRFETASSGEYLFRTIKPGLYPGRTRHIHFAIDVPGRTKLVTQLYVQGDALNASDGVLNGIRDAAARNSVIVPWTAIPTSRIGELSARFDIVLGITPEESPSGTRPVVSTRSGVVSGAAFHSGIAPGSWITIFGDHLAPATRTWTAADIVDSKLPSGLDGVSVQVNNKPASVYFISPRQINIQAPADDATGPVQVTVTTPGGTSNPVTTTMQRFQPAFFRFPQDYVAAVRSDGSYVGPPGLLDGATTVPAKPNDVVLLYGTGFGSTDPAVAAGVAFQGAAPLTNPVTIRIGTVNASVAFGGLVSAGLYQFNVTIPDLPDGDYPVVATAGGVRTQSVARLRIAR